MIKPEDFYNSKDNPGSGSSRRVWRNIKHNVSAYHRPDILSFDKRSFVYGIAASFILYFTGLGIFGTAQQLIERSQPQVIKIDKAYQTAICEFENITPDTRDTPASGRSSQDYLTVRKEQLDNLDATIESLRKETVAGDVSPMLQTRMRQLYSMKLQILQDLVENGEIML